MIRVMAVFDMDPAFAFRFADYVNQKEKAPFTAMAFSDEERLINYGNNHDIEILLLDEKAGYLAEKVKARQVIVLCEGEVVEVRENRLSVGKYQSGDCIMREVMACYCERPVEPTLALLGDRAIVVGVFSPVNRCLKTSFALAMGQLLSRREAVLYLNLEAYSGFSRLMGGEYERDLSDVLYLYRQGGYHWMKLKSMIYNWEKLEYIPPVRYGEDLNQVPPQDMAMLIDRIARESGYDKVIVDVGQMGRDVLPLLEVCDVIYMPVRGDSVSKAKIQEFEEYLKEADERKVRERIQKLKLPYNSAFGKQGNYLEQLLWGELGDYVRRLFNGRNGPDEELSGKEYNGYGR